MLATEAQLTTQTSQPPAILATVADQGAKSPTSAVGGEGWQLVWCHERCHKVDLEPLRTSFSETVEQANGSLLCLKKATGFGRWLARMPNIPFVLLADWREAKPCWEILAQDQNSQLLFTLVYTEQERQFKQASQWAASLRSRGCRNVVNVVPSHIKISELADYVVRTLQRNKTMVYPAGMRRVASHPGTDAMNQIASSPGSPCEGMRRVSSFPGCQSEGSSPSARGPPPGVWASQSPQGAWACKTTVWPRDVQVDQSMEWEAMQQWGQAELECEGMVGKFNTCKSPTLWSQDEGKWMQVGGPTTFVAVPGPRKTFVETEASKWAKPVAEVLSSICKSASWEEIRSALQVSEPDFYED
jgi:hypothetical protein